MNKLVIPSIIAKNQEELDSLISKVKKYFKVMQIDIMDGEFVENKSLDFNFNLPKDIEYEAHLMVKNPLSWAEKNFSKVDFIIFHIEAVSKEDVKSIIQRIKSMNKKVGIAISPNTSIEEILEYISLIDIVVVMSVYPGKYGAKFLPETMDKVKKLREKSPKLLIEVDGGMNLENIKLAMENGANRFISGSFLQNSSNLEETSKKLSKLLKGGVTD
ncbi:MAG: ribulose-phosphate 3-epimerase [Nanoarchaeota archaeon]|nr:ribulose-phosphate 3-epimerase [Nanoarchaeota archaeon]